MKPWYPYVSRTRNKASDGVNESWIVRCEAIGKSNDENRYTIANEWISANLAQFLQLPVPPFSLLRKRPSSAAMFASYSFQGDSTPADVRPPECYQSHPRLCAGILVFDILIANCDRHRGNIKVDRAENPRRIHIIDHEHALFHVWPDEGIKRLRSFDGRLGITGGSVTGESRHIFLDEIDSTDHFAEWIARVGDIPNWFVEEICTAVVNIGVHKKEIGEVKKFIFKRRDSMGELLKQNHSEFTRISEWPLFL